MRAIIVAVIHAAAISGGAAQTADTLKPRGTVSGIIINRATKQPIPGATAILAGTKRGAVSNARGRFSIANVGIGSYSARVSAVGYAEQSIPDVIVRSGRTTTLEIELEETAVATEGVEVTGGYFRTPEVSTTEMSYEELRRSPALGGDINRALVMIPSAVQLDDEANDLVVRGGAPFENGYYIDNIFAPNINHFPQMGATGGNINILNIDFIRNVSLISGGFAPQYGNRLSSVVDIHLREGNREQYDGQLDLNMAGFGGQIEGPCGNSTSFMASAKRSYLDLIASMLNLDGAPRFGDAQAKIVWQLQDDHTITVFDMFGVSEFIRTRDEARENGNGTFGSELYRTNTGGVNLRSLWSENAYSNTSLSVATIDARREWRRIFDDSVSTAYSYVERFYTVRNVNVWQAFPALSVEGGTEWQFYEVQGESGEPRSNVGAATLGQTFGSAFANLSWTPADGLTVSAGARAAYFSASGTAYIEPRAGIRYSPVAGHTMYFTYADVHQSLPAFLLAQNKSNEAAAPPLARHAVAGWQWLAADDLKLTLEGYVKEYTNFPLAPSAPLRFPTDDVAGDEDDFNFYGLLLPNGEAYTRGVELTLQKKLSDKFYGTLGATYFRSAYRDLNGVWRNRLFDNRGVASITVGWKPNEYWELSARWIYAGGRAATPINVEQSRIQGRTVRDAANYMGGHLPAYHALNLRVDRRWYFMNTSLITYLTVSNVYNRENPQSMYWDASTQRIAYESQFPILPILGVEFEF